MSTISFFIKVRNDDPCKLYRSDDRVVSREQTSVSLRNVGTFILQDAALPSFKFPSLAPARLWLMMSHVGSLSMYNSTLHYVSPNLDEKCTRNGLKGFSSFSRDWKASSLYNSGSLSN